MDRFKKKWANLNFSMISWTKHTKEMLKYLGRNLIKEMKSRTKIDWFMTENCTRLGSKDLMLESKWAI